MGLSFFLFYLPEIKFKKKTTSVFSAVPRGHFVIGIKVDLIIKFVILKMDFSDLDGHIHNVVNTRRPERSSSLCANPKTSEFFIFYYYYYYYSFSSDEKTQTFIVIGTQIGATIKLINQSPPSSIYGVLHRERSSLVRQMVCKSMRKQSNLILSAWNLITSLSNRHEKFLRVFPSFFFLLLLYFTLCTVYYSKMVAAQKGGVVEGL